MSPPATRYARTLGLRTLRPSSTWCFLYFEGAITLAALLAFAELAPWSAVVVLPAVVAVMVKINDLVATTLAEPPDAAAERSG